MAALLHILNADSADELERAANEKLSQQYISFISAQYQVFESGDARRPRRHVLLLVLEDRTPAQPVDGMSEFYRTTKRPWEQ